MNLSLADVKAIADSRWKSPLTGWVWGVWLLVFVLLLVPTLLVMAVQFDQPSTYIGPDGQELKVDGGQATIGNIILEDTTTEQDKTIFVVVAVIAGLWYLAIIPVSAYSDYLKAKHRWAILETWSKTKEIPEEEK